MIYRTRNDLALHHPAFKDLEVDSSGNPCVWENWYDDGQDTWCSTWSCQCDDEGIEPYRSDFLPGDEFYALWESLPEAGESLDAAQRHQREQEALTGPEWDVRERATIIAALRFWQRRCDPRDPEMEIATDGDIVALDDGEIDDLIIRIQS